MNEHLENMRRTLDRMDKQLEPYNDEHKTLIDLANHLRDLLEQAKNELTIN